jgi:hypothetical protein
MTNNTNQTGQVNVTELNNAIQHTLIHIDLNKTFFSITQSELDNIEEGTTSIWKDVTLTALGIGLPCCINAWIDYDVSSSLNAAIFLNSLIGGISIILAMIFAIIWLMSKDKNKILMSEIKKRPQYKMP